MAKKINTGGLLYGSSDGHLNEDVQRFRKQPNEWSQARNAVTNTVIGDVGDLSNEMSNYLAVTVGTVNPEIQYKIIGAIHIGSDEWVIFSTNNVNSEIGLFKEDSLSYNALINNANGVAGRSLDFNTSNLIKGVGRTTFDCGRRVYWDDGVNPTRTLDIDNIPWVQECSTDGSNCQICVDNVGVLDVDRIRLAPLIDKLSFKVERGKSSGQLLNGSYYVVGAYLVEGQRITDYTLPSNVQVLFDHDNMASTLDVYVEHADKEFDSFELVLVQFSNFNTVAYKVGTYSTRQNKITLDTVNERWEKVDPSLILINNPIPDKSDAVYRNGDYLLRVGPVEKFDFNYQPLANQIKTSWISVEYPADYYRDGGSNVGFMRDEVYSFFIRWVYNTGDKSRSYHIPGRVAIPDDVSNVSGKDVLSSDGTDLKKWKIYNTAKLDITYPNRNTVLPDGGVILGGGDMGYWESTEIYDDKNPTVWNTSHNPMWGSNNPAYDLCGMPIRHHKFPANDLDSSDYKITNHYNPTIRNSSNQVLEQGGSKIRVMGVQFSNVKPPLDNYGNPITNIVGYEILRGSREGNKTVLAKGMINNLREYTTIDSGKSKTYLYPNYPYNPRNTFSNSTIPSDKFLSSTATSFAKSTDGGFGAKPNDWGAYLKADLPMGVDINSFPQTNYRTGNIRKDLLTFHSPETNFRNPFLSAKEIRVYGELVGEMIGNFEIPKDHPRAKLITGTAFVVSAILGLGFAMLSTQGERTHTHYTPKIDHGGTYTFAGPLGVGGTGMLGGLSTPAATAMSAAVGAASTANGIVESVFSASLPAMILSAAGVNPNIILDSSHSITGNIAGSVGGTGSQDVYGSKMTAWAATPTLLRVIQGIPAFLSFWGEGIDKILKMIYSFVPYRQYALQQVSHSFYNDFVTTRIGELRREIDEASYLKPVLQDFARDYRINNIYRSRTVALKLTDSLELPISEDSSQLLYSDVHNRIQKLHWSDEDYIASKFTAPTASHYVAIKQRLDNQYGQVQSITQVPISTEYTDISQTTSPVLFNGDTYIGRYTEKNTMFFFYDWLNGQPDGFEFNYKLKKMLTHPRFWMDTDPFDIGEFINSLGKLFGGSGATPGFDPFAIDPKYTQSQIPATKTYNPLNVVDLENNPYMANNPDYNVNAKCDCTNDTECYFNKSPYSSLFNSICDAKTDLDAEQFEYDKMVGCACRVFTSDEWKDTDDECTACNPDNESLVEFLNDDSNELNGNQDNCNSYNWSNKDAAKYACKDKGQTKRQIRRQERKLARAQKRYDKAVQKLYDKYIETISSSKNDNTWLTVFRKLDTPSDKYAFDMRDPSGFFRMDVKEAFMYLFNSGVRDFFVESEINIDVRDWGEKPEERHYDHKEYTNLKEMFSSDYIKSGNFMKYDYSLSISKLFNNFVSWGLMQDRNYNPDVAENCYVYRPKRVLYSLPQHLENRKDNWRVFLPMNYKDFNSVVTAIKPIGKNGAIFLFNNESPVQVIGVDTMETDNGTKVTIGDGGLFNQPLQNLVNAEYPSEFGSCQNRLGIINTPHGLFYMSQNQGKVFMVRGNQLSEISNRGMKWWFAKYLPYKLTSHPTAFLQNGIQREFDLKDNPVIGVGCQVIYDNINEIVYFCKKDWAIRTDIADTITYLSGTTFLVNGILNVELGNPDYFRPASWTVSWDPKIDGGQGGWVSYHDWHPDLVISSKHTFMTTKDADIWVHADRCDSYCNFYGINYPFEVEFTTHTNNDVNTIRNITYLMEAYIYNENCMDRFHVLDENFDEAVVYNSEQCSGLLRLNLTPKNNPIETLRYPIINLDNIDILYSKEEQKYRFNQFWDITDDRGEFNPDAIRTIFLTEDNGYIRNLNPGNLDYNKNQLERKKFRHYEHIVLLRKRVSGNKNIVVSLLFKNNLNSPR